MIWFIFYYIKEQICPSREAQLNCKGKEREAKHSDRMKQSREKFLKLRRIINETSLANDVEINI